MSKEPIIKKLIQLINETSIACAIDQAESFTPLLEAIDDARLVLMGEASHGTQEFYETRIELSKRLILEKNFNAIAIEGDWTSAYPVGLYVLGLGEVDKPEMCLEGFKRFPEWMWRNESMTPFLRWLRQHNETKDKSEKVGFYGLDLYCLHDSMQAVIHYLYQRDPLAAQVAMQRYSCFDHLHDDPQHYAYLVECKLKKPCVKEVTAQFLDMQKLLFSQMNNQNSEEEALFCAAQNARLVKNAEYYYRSLFGSHHHSWNIRDQHMAETLQNLLAHLENKLKKQAKVIVWAHNSHVGDARATEMSDKKELNLGQLVREQFKLKSFLLGFSTYAGTVTAADQWASAAKIKTVLPALSGSYEALFHQVKNPNFLLNLRQDSRLAELLTVAQLQRAIGVIYRPETERVSHYYLTKLAQQFDSLIHLDETQAVRPLA